MKRNQRIGINLSVEEKEVLIRLAYLEGGLSLAALMRRLIRKDAFDKGIWGEYSRAHYQKVKGFTK